MRQTKRDELVEKATAIFYRNGFQATGMDRLVAETGISKTSIYKHFETKDDLIVATLKSRDAFLRGWLFGRMAELTSSPREQLIAIGALPFSGERHKEPYGSPREVEGIADLRVAWTDRLGAAVKELVA